MLKTIRERVLNLGLLVGLIHASVGQIGDFQESYGFLLHLQNNGSYNEGVHFLSRISDDFTGGKSDTLSYLMGIFHYEMKNIDESILAFKQVGRANPSYYAQSKLLSSFQYAYKGSYDEAAFIDTLDFHMPLYNELKITELAGVSLLTRNFSAFQHYSGQFTGGFYQLKGIQEKLLLNKEGLMKVKNKSSIKAGVLSGLMPGLGKFYLGKVGEGYLTLLLSTVLALQVREAYIKDGASSARFKIFSGIFGAVYIANIWGSAVAVKVYKREINDTYDEAILINMHIPLRTVFD